MSRARKITVFALIVAIVGWCWGYRGWFWYMWATWREGKADD
jgi:hypothetical protein